jgi:hypothetical protein
MHLCDACGWRTQLWNSLILLMLMLLLLPLLLLLLLLLQGEEH